MGSDANKMNDATSFHPCEPALCANGCRFFGTAAKMNLCTKCFNDLRVKDLRHRGSCDNESAVAEEKVKVSNRCLSCNKKVGVMGFKWKCGEIFYGSHRYPENHDCEFDFRRAGRWMSCRFDSCGSTLL
ncbi:hypothetical protein L6452_37025 [Arctium lappa]|uniref:Uncharacterized protein n=1 Tax=Arctium lappa TaxID=4217 RepID=A0ACB8Y2K8_ARCLA|nr:hypothetical protein L6452_37025 [Arctium lappa]